LNYSILKKALVRIARHNQSNERAGLLQDDEAADLFESLLNSELAKINNFFNERLKAYLSQYNRYSSQVVVRSDPNIRKTNYVIQNSDEAKVSKENLRMLYREVDGLANYAVLNTMGIKRILLVRVATCCLRTINLNVIFLEIRSQIVNRSQCAIHATSQAHALR
jgi:SPX domain protein involved in polyphosphate accumulation